MSNTLAAMRPELIAEFTKQVFFMYDGENDVRLYTLDDIVNYK